MFTEVFYLAVNKTNNKLDAKQILIKTVRFWYKIFLRQTCLPMVRETGVQSQVESYNRLKLDSTLLNSQHYKVRIKGKVEQSRELSSALLYTSV